MSETQQIEKKELKFRDVKYLPPDEALVLKDPKNAESKLFFLKSYFMSRYSSAERVKINTTLTTIGGTFFGLGQSIYKKLPKQQTCLRFGVGSFCLGLSYFSLNEIINGWVVRQFNREQYFVSNSLSAFINMIVYYGIQTQFRNIASEIALPQATKYLMSICVASMVMEVFIIGRRDIYLQREQGKNYGFSITKIEGTESFEDIKKKKEEEQTKKVEKLIEEQKIQQKQQLEQEFQNKK